MHTPLCSSVASLPSIDMHTPLRSSIASSPSVDDICRTLSSMSESVIDVNPHTPTSTIVHRPPTHELDCTKSSCTNVSVHPLANTTLEPCTESSCAIVAVNPHATPSNPIHEPPPHEHDCAKSSCTNVGVHPLATSSNITHRPHTEGHTKSSSASVTMNPLVSSTNIHRPPTHELDCAKISLWDAKSLQSALSNKKTSPLSPRLSTGNSSTKRSKRQRKDNSDFHVKSKSRLYTAFDEEKSDLGLHDSITQHQKRMPRKRTREIDRPLTSSVDDRIFPAQQLVLAGRSNVAHYPDSSSSSTSRHRHTLNFRDAGGGRKKHHKTYQLSFSPKECCRPRNAFIFFSMKERQKIAAAHLHVDFGEISKLVAWSWHNMSDADKQPYRMLALQDAKRYHNEVSQSHRTWERLADRGLQLLYVVDFVCEWLSQKLPQWAKCLARPSLGSNPT